MAMGNPYYVEPLGGLDVGAKLTQVMEGGRAVARRKEWEDNAAKIIQGGNPTEISNLMVKFPEMTDTIQNAMGLSKKSTGTLLDIAKQTLAIGEVPLEQLAAVIQGAKENGENVDLPIQLLQKLSEDPSYGAKWAERYTATFDPKSYEGYRKTLPEGMDPTATQKEYNMAVLQGYQGSFMDYQKELKEAGRSSTEVTNIIGDKVTQKLGEEMAKNLVERRDVAQGAVKGLENIRPMVDLLNKGIITGKGAEFITSFGNVLSERFGIKFSEDAVANTEAYQAAAGRQVGELIKMFGAGTGLSDADREYAQKIAGGQISVTEKSLRRILDIADKASRNAVRTYNKDAKKAEKRVGDENLLYELQVQEPPGISIDPAPLYPEQSGVVKPVQGIKMELKKYKNVPSDVTADDVQYTMEKEGLTFEEVMQMVGATK